MKRSQVDFFEGPLLKNIIIYTVPIILTSVLQLLFNAADLIVVGRFAENGSLSVGAVGATSALIHLLVNFFIGLSVGVCVTIAQGLGSGDIKNVQDSVHTTIPTAVICGAIITVIGCLFSKTFLELMGTPEDVLPLADIYIKIYFLGMIPSMLYNFASAILRAAGNTQDPLIYLVIAGVLNVILNLIFVIALKMDVAGVALATTLSQIVSAVLAVIALTKRTDACQFRLKDMRIDIGSLKKILSIGIPAGIQSAMFNIANVLIQSSINSFGTVAVAGSSAAGNIEGFVYVAMNAFQQTVLNFSGQNFGAKNYKRLKKSIYLSLACVSVVGIITGTLAYIFGRQLLGIYITDSEEAIKYGLMRMVTVCLPYFLCGIMEVITGALRGIGSSATPMIITVVGVCVMRIVWIYTVFASNKTLTCLFLSYPISWALTFIAETIAFIIIWSRKKKMLQEA